MRPLQELESAFLQYAKSKACIHELNETQRTYNGRPSPLYFAKNLSKHLTDKAKGKQAFDVYLKLENLNHTGAHKMNNALGQALLAKYMGKKKVVAETGAGQHGLATAAACAKLGLECCVFMGETDIRRQYPNVFSMKLMGARVIAVKEGNKTLKDAVNAALKYWIEHVSDTHYILGSALGPSPYPQIVQYFQAVIGKELRMQLRELRSSEKTDKKQDLGVPDAIVACVGGGSNALGIFTEFLDERTALFAAEAGGEGIKSGKHATRLRGKGKTGISQGYKSYFLQNKDGQLSDTYSISAGLDYAGISPILAQHHDSKRIHFRSVTDVQALKAYQLLSQLEGIIPALETSHALSLATRMTEKAQLELLPTPKKNRAHCIVINISGRGEKDLFITAAQLDADNWNQFLSKELSRER